MDTDLKNFIETNRATGKSRKLDRFAEQITILKDLGFSDSDVLRFLSEKKGVVVSQRTLTRFINRNKTMPKEHPAGKPVAESRRLPKSEAVRSIPVQSEASESETVAGTKPFNWEEAKKEDWHDLI